MVSTPQQISYGYTISGNLTPPFCGLWLQNQMLSKLSLPAKMLLPAGLQNRVVDVPLWKPFTKEREDVFKQPMGFKVLPWPFDQSTKGFNVFDRKNNQAYFQWWIPGHKGVKINAVTGLFVWGFKGELGGLVVG